MIERSESSVLTAVLELLQQSAADKGMTIALHADMNMLEAGFDSFDFAALIPALEERLHCVINLADADLAEIIRIGGLASYVARAGCSEA